MLWFVLVKFQKSYDTSGTLSYDMIWQARMDLNICTCREVSRSIIIRIWERLSPIVSSPPKRYPRYHSTRTWRGSTTCVEAFRFVVVSGHVLCTRQLRWRKRDVHIHVHHERLLARNTSEYGSRGLVDNAHGPSLSARCSERESFSSIRNWVDQDWMIEEEHCLRVAWWLGVIW